METAVRQWEKWAGSYPLRSRAGFDILAAKGKGEARSPGKYMKEKKWNQYVAWGITAFAVIAASAGVIFLLINLEAVSAALSMVIGILKPVIYGTVMAYLLSPIYNKVSAFTFRRLCKQCRKPAAAKRWAKAAATLVSVVVLCAVAVGLVAMMLPELYRSIMNVVNSLPENISRFSAWMNQELSGQSDYQQALLLLYQNATSFFEDFLNNTVRPNLSRIISQAYSGVASVLMWFYDIAIGLIVMIYLLNIKEVLLPQFKKLIYALLPTDWAERTVKELRYIHEVFGGFIIGKIVDSLIIGLMCFTILSFLNMVGILHMPYVLLVSVIVGVTNVIPFFGPFIGAIPSTILIMLSSPLQGLYFLVFVFLLQQFDGNFLGPKILGDRTGISSFWVLFSILLFGGLFGFAGMIIAVPTWAVFMNLLSKISARLLHKKGLPGELSYYGAKKKDEI